MINGADVVVDNYTIPISGLAVGNYTLTVTTVPDGDHVSVTKTASIIVKNLYLTVNVTSVDTHNRTVNITAVSNIYGGKLRFVLPDGKEVNATYAADGKWWAVHTFDYYGVYQVSAAYDGLGELTVNDGTVNITKANSTITLEDVELHVGESTDLTVETKGAVEITAKINNNEVSVIDKFTIPIYNLTMGVYTLTVTTVPDAEHNAVTKTVKLSVSKYNTPLDIEIEFFNDTRKNVRIIAAADPLITGSLEFIVGEKTVSRSVNEDGIAVYELYLPVGDYTVNVNYPGDDMFNSKSASESFTVKEPGKVDSTVVVVHVVDGYTVTVGVIVFEEQDSENFFEHIGGLITGTGDTHIFENLMYDGLTTLGFNMAGIGPVGDLINVALGFFGTVLDGSADPCDLTSMAKGVASIGFGAAYGSGAAFASVVAVDIAAWLYTLDEEDDDLPKATGLATVEIDGIKYAVDIENGVGMFKTNFTPGHYNVFAKYYGDDVYKPGTGRDAFEVSKPYKYTPKVVAVPSVNGTTVTLNITVSSNETSDVPSGNVTLGVLGQTFIVNLNNGTALFTYDFAIGTYGVNVTYLGDNKFKKATTNVSFTVQDIVSELKNTTVDVDVEVIKNIVTITASVDSLASGLIEFNIDGNAVYIPVMNGQAVYETKLDIGNYTVDVTYLGDSRFNGNSTNASFEVNYVKLNPEIDAVVEVNGRTVSINISVGLTDLNETDLENATGQVRIGVSGQSFIVPVVDGTAAFTFDFASGIYDAEIAYLGDENYNSASTAVKFIVNDPYKIDTVVTATSRVRGTVVTIYIDVGIDGNSSDNVEVNITGNVTVEVLNQTFTVPVVDGKAVFTHEFEPGTYDANIIYEGDENFNPALTTVEFESTEIIPSDAEIDVIVDVNGTNVTFYIHVGSNASEFNATGDVLIDIMGHTFQVSLENGSGVFTYEFDPGTYGVNVIYFGDDFFNNASKTVSFTVLDISPGLMNTAIDLIVVAVDNDVTITATVNETATGIIEFTINGNTAYIAVNNGQAVYNTILNAGDYEVSVTYLGDSRFNGNRTSLNFTVSDYIKKNTSIESSVTVDGSDVGITVVVDETATGFVEFRLNNNTFYSKVVDGVATLNIILSPGDYELTAIYLGDDKFNSAIDTALFTVVNPDAGMVNTTLDVSVEAIENNVSIAARVNESASGLVEFVIDGQAVYVAVNNGEAVYDVVLPGGSYNVTVTYMGDDRFNPNSTVVSFDVDDHEKLNTTVDCNVVVNDNNVTVTVNVNPNSTGWVRFEVSGAENHTLIVQVENGVAVLKKVLPAGDYTVRVTYLGDDRFNMNATSASFAVLGHVKKDTEITAVPIVDGSTVTIETTLNSNATGYVTVSVLGQNFLVPVNGGKAVFTYDFAPGNYESTITYLGDDNFNNATATASFTVKQQTGLKNTPISVDAVVTDLNVVVTVTLDSAATGVVEFKLNGNATYLPVRDGKLVLNDTFKPGEYNLTVTYLGDGVFNSNSTVVNFTVNKVKTQIIASNVATTYKTGKTLTITLTDGKGNPLIGKIVAIKFNNKVYNKKTNSKGIISFAIGKTLVPKTYKASITFAGDDTYINSAKSVKVTVKKAKAKITAKKKTFKKSKKVKKYTIALKSGKTLIKKVKVTIKIGKKTYKAKTNKKGKATFKIKKLTKKGKYKAVIKFKGNKYYNKVTKKVKIKIK